MAYGTCFRREMPINYESRFSILVWSSRSRVRKFTTTISMRFRRQDKNKVSGGKSIIGPAEGNRFRCVRTPLQPPTPTYCNFFGNLVEKYWNPKISNYRTFFEFCCSILLGKNWNRGLEKFDETYRISPNVQDSARKGLKLKLGNIRSSHSEIRQNTIGVKHVVFFSNISPIGKVEIEVWKNSIKRISFLQILFQRSILPGKKKVEIGAWKNPLQLDVKRYNSLNLLSEELELEASKNPKPLEWRIIFDKARYPLKPRTIV